jgi:hypothetical protein
MRKNSPQIFGLIGLLTVMFLAGCGSAAEPLADQGPSPQIIVVTATAEPPTQTPVIIVVTATEEAQTGAEADQQNAGDVQENEEAAAAPQIEASTTQEPPTATAVPPSAAALVPVCQVESVVRLRTGPGQIYGIIRNLSAGTELSPQAFVARGFPAGAWLLVSTGTQQGWVSADPDLVSCNVEPASLPAPAVIPPTPTPLPPPTAVPPTPTPVVVAQAPISIGQPTSANNPDAGDFPQGRVEWYLETSNDFLFRFFIRDKDAGERDGAGIDTVTLTVLDQSGNVVDSRTEGTAGYCIFGGGEPNCNSWVIENGVYKWKSTGQTVVDGTYNLNITVHPKYDDRDWSWFLGDFYVDVP